MLYSYLVEIQAALIIFPFSDIFTLHVFTIYIKFKMFAIPTFVKLNHCLKTGILDIHMISLYKKLKYKKQ